MLVLNLAHVTSSQPLASVVSFDTAACRRSTMEAYHGFDLLGDFQFPAPFSESPNACRFSLGDVAPEQARNARFEFRVRKRVTHCVRGIARKAVRWRR